MDELSTDSRYEDQTSFRVDTRNQFLYDQPFGVVISCSVYDKVLTHDGKRRFADMPEAEEEGEEMIRGLK